MVQVTDHAVGKHFTCRDGFAHFFSVIGQRLENGNWGFIRPDADEFRVMDEWDPEDPKITKPFEFWLRRGAKKQSKFTHLHLTPTYAVLAFLGGRLTVAHLKTAVEYSDHIDIPSVNLGLENHLATVRVLHSSTRNIKSMMAADERGRAL